MGKLEEKRRDDEGKITRQRKYQLRHKERGLCVECKNKAINKKYCKVHNDKYAKARKTIEFREKHNLYMKKYRKKVKVKTK